MRKTNNVSVTFVIVVIFSISLPMLYAGDLNPVSPPGSTMKTLDEVEPRIAINNENTPGDSTATYIISSPGSYYLTNNITSNFKHAILINSSDVTLDLMGYRIYSSYMSIPSGANTSFDGIHISEEVKNIKIQNGSIISRNEPSGLFHYKGFRYGIACVDTGVERISVINVSIIGSRSHGVYLLYRDHIKIENSQIMNNEGCGILLGDHCKVTNCEVASNGLSGIWLEDHATVRECEVHDNGSLDSYSIAGIEVGNGSKVKDNKVYDNFNSISATHIYSIKLWMGCEATGNCVYNNATSLTGFSYFYGLFAGQGCTISGNTIYFNGTAASGYKIYGLYAVYGCTITGNTVYENFKSANVTEGDHNGSITGLHGSTSCTVIGNTVTHNNDSATGTCYGIHLGSYSFVDQNTSYENNGTNIYAPSTCVLVNNVAP